MTIVDALLQIERFRGGPLAGTIANIESQLAGAESSDALAINTTARIDKSLVASAAQVKRVSAQIDFVIHAVGILHPLPCLLETGEVVETVSLALYRRTGVSPAGNHIKR